MPSSRGSAQSRDWTQVSHIPGRFLTVWATRKPCIWPHYCMKMEGKKVEVVTDFLFLGSKIIADGDCSHEIEDIASRQESDGKPRQCVEKQRHYSADKCPHSQVCGLPRDHVWFWELDHKEGRTPKNWCLRTVVLEKTPETSLDSKEIKPVSLKGDQPWIFTGRTDAEAETPVFGSSDAAPQDCPHLTSELIAHSGSPVRLLSHFSYKGGFHHPLLGFD